MQPLLPWIPPRIHSAPSTDLEYNSSSTLPIFIDDSSPLSRPSNRRYLKMAEYFHCWYKHHIESERYELALTIFDSLAKSTSPDFSVGKNVISRSKNSNSVDKLIAAMIFGELENFGAVVGMKEMWSSVARKDWSTFCEAPCKKKK